MEICNLASTRSLPQLTICKESGINPHHHSATLQNLAHNDMTIVFNNLNRCLSDTIAYFGLIFGYKLMEQAYGSFAISGIDMPLKRIKRF